MSALQDETTFNLKAQIAEYGQTVTLRNLTTLSGPSPYPNPFMLQSLELNGSHSGGVTALNLKATGLNGRLIAGDRLIVGLDPVTYTVTAQVTSAANAMAAVPIAPALGAAEADGTAVGVDFFADTDIPGLVTSYPARLVVNTAIQQGDRQLRVLASSLSWAPTTTDKVIIGADQYSIITAKGVTLRGTLYAWALQIRGGHG